MGLLPPKTIYPFTEFYHCLEISFEQDLELNSGLANQAHLVIIHVYIWKKKKSKASYTPVKGVLYINVSLFRITNVSKTSFFLWRLRFTNVFNEIVELYASLDKSQLQRKWNCKGQEKGLPRAYKWTRFIISSTFTLIFLFTRRQK